MSKNYTLRDVCSALHSGKCIDSSRILEHGPYPVFGGNGIRGYCNQPNFDGTCAIIGRQGVGCGNVHFFSGKAYMTEHAVIAQGKDFCDTKYLYYLLSSMKLGRLSAQSAQPGLAVNVIGKEAIQIPSIGEQKAIAETLSRLDDMVSSLDSLIEKKRNIREAALDALITRKSRLDGFSDNWIMVSFDEVITPKARIGWQGLKKDEYLTQGYSYLISGTDFFNGHINLVGINYVSQERYDLDVNIQIIEDDVLVTKDGTVGKVAIVQKLNHPATLNSGVFVFRTKQGLHPKFLYRVLSSSVFTSFIDALSAGSTIKHLYQKDLKLFKFNMPSSVSEQLAISEILDVLDNEISALEAERDKWKQIRDGAMDDLLTGRVRLKDWEV